MAAVRRVDPGRPLRSSCASCVDVAPVLTVEESDGRQLDLCGPCFFDREAAGRYPFVPREADLSYRARSVS